MTPARQVVKLAADPQFAARDWDSYKAEPIPLRTFWHALGFALALPEDCRAGCHVAPESSGEIMFEWDARAPGLEVMDRPWVIVEINSAGEAGWTYYHPGKSHSVDETFTFTGAIPEDLIEAIRSLK